MQGSWQVGVAQSQNGCALKMGLAAQSHLAQAARPRLSRQAGECSMVQGKLSTSLQCNLEQMSRIPGSASEEGVEACVSPGPE